MSSQPSQQAKDHEKSATADTGKHDTSQPTPTLMAPPPGWTMRDKYLPVVEYQEYEDLAFEHTTYPDGHRVTSVCATRFGTAPVMFTLPIRAAAKKPEEQEKTQDSNWR